MRGKKRFLKLCASVAFLFIAINSSADTYISGIIDSNTIWGISSSPYIVTGHILVANGATLTIEPGVEVKFDGYYYIQIEGELIANGAEESQIIFTSNKSNPSTGDWQEIRFKDSSIDAIVDESINYSSGSAISYAVIEYGGGILIHNSYPYIANNLFSNNSGTTNPNSCCLHSGVLTFQHTIDDSDKTLVVQNNIIEKNAVSGIGGGKLNDLYQSSNLNVLIMYNKIINNGGAGFEYGGDENPNYNLLFSHNIIYQNSGGGVGFWNGDLNDIVEYNIIACNTGGAVYGSGGGIGFYSGSPTIRYNSIINNLIQSGDPNVGSVSAIGESVNASIVYNTIIGNSGAPSFYFSDWPNTTENPTINYNNISNSSNTYEVYLSPSKSSDLDMSNNWWGTTDTEIIDLRIYDYNDDFELGEVIYDPILLSPNTAAPISPPTNLSFTIDGDNIVLTWDGLLESDLEGYKVYYDTDSGYPYSDFIDVGNVTTYTLTGLNLYDIYHVAVTSYDVDMDNTDDWFDGNESWFSDEIIADECPNDLNKIVPGICGCGVADTDTDGDSTADCNDGCPDDVNKTEAGVCGCGVAEADTDTDGDGTQDCIDGCPDDVNKTEAGICGCGVADTDTDGDGTADCNDGCPDDVDKTGAGICGCGIADTDTDGDGTQDCLDGCPDDLNKTEAGVCGCGVADTDTDGDGTADCNDECPYNVDKTEAGVCGCSTYADTDGDGTDDCLDGCPFDVNKTEAEVCGCGVADTDTDSDGTADCNDECDEDPLKTEVGICGCGVADTDTDGDGTQDCIDGCPDDVNKTEAGVCGCGVADTDTDSDGTADCNDIDDDNDGTLDADDDFPLDSTETLDTDEDGTGDNADTDDDNDGISDEEEVAGPNGGDSNNDGISDSLQSNVGSLNVENSLDYIVLVSPTGTEIANCQCSDRPANAPATAVFDYGLFEFTLKGVAAGGSTIVTLSFPDNASAFDTYYKFGPSADNATPHWYEFIYDGQTGAIIDNKNKIITLHFIDGARGDDDLSENGTVVDIGGPARTLTTDEGVNGGGGGGGCYISTLRY